MSEPKRISDLLPGFFSRLEKKINLSHCADCGQYLRPDQGRSILRDSGPVVLCDTCLGKEIEREAETFFCEGAKIDSNNSGFCFKNKETAVSGGQKYTMNRNNSGCVACL
ncbi:MAG TPA: hypothetical protein PKB02_13170 [Anaerohalosphaeraceae bacterium]|nr:hypothetical protein [Anaerohalosphaeraceae bacterium]